MRQFLAGLKKEILFFVRGFRLPGVIIGFVASALFSPLLFGLMGFMADMDLGLEEAGMGEMSGMFAMYQGESGFQLSYIATLDSFAGLIALVPIIVMAVLMGTAGKEQKKRSIIMPRTAGLTPAGHILPKFVLYPPLMFVLTVGSLFLSNAVSYPIFGVAFSVGQAALVGSLAGLAVMFLVSLHLFLGNALAQPGLSIIYVLAGNMVISLVLTMAFEVTAFTPFNLMGMASSIVMNGSSALDTTEMIATMAITAALCVIFMLLTLFAMVAKKVDNTADEVY